MVRKGIWTRMGMLLVVLSLLMSFTSINLATAQTVVPEMLHPRLGVRPVVTGLNFPTTMAFLSPSEILVLEKNTGKVQGADDETAEKVARCH